MDWFIYGLYGLTYKHKYEKRDPHTYQEALDMDIEVEDDMEINPQDKW